MGNWDVSKPNKDGERELLDRAVKALEAELATKTCNNKQVISKLVASEDCISRQEALNCFKIDNNKGDVWYALKELPPVTPKQRTGHWIYDRTRDWDGECKYECSCCGMGSDVDYAYCMRCGARMVEPQESEEISREEIAALLARESEEMTREEAIEELSILLNKYQDGRFGDAIDMAMTALEQEPFINKSCVSNGICEHDKQNVLDKIKAEIKQLPYQRIFGKVSNYSLIDTVIEIIDKYKAESEE